MVAATQSELQFTRRRRRPQGYRYIQELERRLMLANGEVERLATVKRRLETRLAKLERKMQDAPLRISGQGKHFRG